MPDPRKAERRTGAPRPDRFEPKIMSSMLIADLEEERIVVVPLTESPEKYLTKLNQMPRIERREVPK